MPQPGRRVRAMAMRKLALVTVSATAAVLLLASAPSLFARGAGGAGGGGARGGGAGDDNGEAPPPTTGPGQSAGFGGTTGDGRDGIDGDGLRDGAEQDAIARDAVGGR